MDQASQHWILLIYRVPQDPPGRRTYVWRQLKHLGAIYLQQAAAILPDTPAIRAAAEGLANWIRDVGGDVSLLSTVSPCPGWEQGIVERFNAARNEEYAEVVENIERFEDEIQRETRKEKFTFAELEDLEADWAKLQSWIERIHTRDFFHAPDRLAAAAALDQARTRLETFTTSVYAHEDVQEQEPPQGDTDDADR